MSPYQAGFEVGYQDVKQGEHGAFEEAMCLAQAESHGEPLLTSVQEADYWLGYYHGRAYAHTRDLPASEGWTMPQKLIITTIPGEDTVRVQLDELPPRRMTKDDAHTLTAKAIDEGVTIERRTALGTIIIG